jgi:hypothetical protein
LNNNRGNNRRRGRGNNNRPQGGGQQLNRIDSRARGNAPQLLEKYRKLAHDAHLNGDRVTEEYYLQFADHYFRVLADTRVRPEDRPRRDERWQEPGEDGDEAGEYGNGEYQPYEQNGYARPERTQERTQERAPERTQDRPERAPRDDRARDDRPRDDRSRGEQPREDRPRDERPERKPRAEPAVPEASADEFDGAEEQPRNIYEPPANPFVRENRPTRGLRPRRDDRRPRPADEETADGAEAPVGIDVSVLPPSVNASRDDGAGDVAVADEAPAPKRRGRKPKVAAVADGEG